MSVIEIDIKSREPYPIGKEIVGVEGYERIDASLKFGVYPDHPENAAIVDLEFAPRDSNGMVCFTADLTILTPVGPKQGNHGLLLELPNRGRRRVVANMNRAGAVTPGSIDIPPGDGFLFRHGFTVASIGWQWDVPPSDELMGLQAPVASIDGTPIRGQVSVEMRPNIPENTRLLANRVHEPYRATDTAEESAVLLVRDYEDDEDTVIDRSSWCFGMELDGRIEQSNAHIYLESGFVPGKIYNAVYTTEGAPIVGSGLIAVRDVGAFLREKSAKNPCGSGFERAYAYGVSQTGRMLRHFMYLGLNVDEQGRRVFDGMLPHVAGARRGEFNHRFAQPSVHSVPGFGHLFPFADKTTIDPFSGEQSGLLDRLRERDAVPKIVYTNTSAEYWRGDASLVHVDPSGKFDLESSSDTRIYHFSGTQHAPGSVPQTFEDRNEGSRGRYGFNVVDHAPLLRAALMNLDRWVKDGIEPPPDRHPRLDAGTAVERSAVLRTVSEFPDQSVLDPGRLWVQRTIDLGPESTKGIGRYPVIEGDVYPSFVSDVDIDGNEIDGIPLPDIGVPVGTHFGWNPRDPETGAPEQHIAMMGATRFFPATRADRESTGDPRISIEERYHDREDYMTKVTKHTQILVSDGYLLEEDIDLVVSNAMVRYDFVVGQDVPR